MQSSKNSTGMVQMYCNFRLVIKADIMITVETATPFLMFTSFEQLPVFYVSTLPRLLTFLQVFNSLLVLNSFRKLFYGCCV